MAACPSCGSPVAADARFCGNCGADLASLALEPRFCTNCGGPLEKDDRFCGRCGAPARGPAAAAQPEAEAEAEQEPEAEEDFFADWNVVFAEEPSPREAVTEAVPHTPVERGSDTEVLQPMPAPEPPPSAPAPKPPPTPRHAPPRGFPWGASIALTGAVAVVISAILPWTSNEALPREIAARSLIGTGDGGINLGVVLLVAGTIGALVALVTMLLPWLGFLRRLVGILTLAVPVLFVLRALDPAAGLSDLARVLGAGVYAAAGGALAQVLAGKLRT
jgi:hypothetical protein